MFAVIIGKCVIISPPPKLAVLLILWLFGAVPGMSYESYKEQYIAAGGTDVEKVEACFSSWEIEKQIPWKHATAPASPE